MIKLGFVLYYEWHGTDDGGTVRRVNEGRKEGEMCYYRFRRRFFCGGWCCGGEGKGQVERKGDGKE